MITESFSSETSNDSIIVKHHERSHKTFFTLQQFDDFAENIKLISHIIEYLKSYDIKWVELRLGLNFEVPTNTVWFKNKRNGNINCHIEDFEQFYLANMANIVKPGNLSVKINDNNKDDSDQDNSINDDGGEWTTVCDKRQVRRQKMDKIKKEVDTLLGDWNNLK